MLHVSKQSFAKAVHMHQTATKIQLFENKQIDEELTMHKLILKCLILKCLPGMHFLLCTIKKT